MRGSGILRSSRPGIGSKHRKFGSADRVVEIAKDLRFLRDRIKEVSMGRGRVQASAAEGIADAVVFSILLLVALWVLSVIFPGFAATFGFFNSLLFALAYFVARVVYTPVKALVASRLG